MNIDDTSLVPVQPAGFLVEGCTNYGVDGWSNLFIDLFVQGTVVFQDFLDDCPLLPNDLPRLT